MSHEIGGRVADEHAAGAAGGKILAAFHALVVSRWATCSAAFIALVKQYGTRQGHRLHNGVLPLMNRDGHSLMSSTIGNTGNDYAKLCTTTATE